MVILLSALCIKTFADNPPDVTQIMNMSLEDILNTKVTSASGREQKQREVASAMTVITKKILKDRELIIFQIFLSVFPACR